MTLYNRRDRAAREGPITNRPHVTNLPHPHISSIQSINPATGAVLATFDALDEGALEARLDLAVSAFAGWKKTSFQERAALMALAADLLERDADEIARIMTLEMGKPLRDARGEALKSARGCRYYAEHAESFLRDEEVATEAKRSYIRYEPLGPVLAIMPWNFPFWQVFQVRRAGADGRQCGAAETCAQCAQCALFIEGIFTRAGFRQACSRICS